ncbi:MAG: transporter substrate-binding domain-containing protein, partial [Burkholderiaceae bacterium]|nr:transporter substrate-binding domain-containing protein [Burkholderiaceae bacterium]
MLIAIRSAFATLVVLAAVVMHPAGAQEVVRFCADPDNPPFSVQSPAPGQGRGLYVEIAERVAAQLGARAEFAWWLTHYGRRAVRNTLFAKQCDAFVGLPNDRAYLGRQALLSKPFIRVGYALVLPATMQVGSLEDLRGKRVAVQFNTPPQLLLAQRDLTAVTFRSGEEALAAIGREADLAFVWGPLAGDAARRRADLRVVPVAGEGMQWEAVFAVRAEDAALKARLDAAIDALAPEIRALAEKYAFPLAAPVPLTAAAPLRLAQAAAVASDARPERRNPFSGNREAIGEGRLEFNVHCSHCHAQNAQSAEQRLDLRRLRIRYADRWPLVALATIRDGRTDKGMPTWKDM